jgi:hypothetical protein
MLDAHAAEDIKSALRDPWKVCQQLNLLDHAKRQALGLIIRCPSHGERNPSCSVTRGPDGTIRVICFSCGFAGDVFHLVAAVDGLDVQHDFRKVLARAAELAGYQLGSEEHRGPRPMAPPAPPPPFPPEHQVRAIWNGSYPVSADRQASEYFTDRGLVVAQLDAVDLVRVVPSRLPDWACYGERSWQETGHRAIVRMFDERGEFRSVRAIRVTYGGDIPKRLPPKGYRASGVVMATMAGVSMLSGELEAKRVLVCEGEPDFISWASQPFDGADLPLLGIVSGSWTGDISARIKDGTNVAVMTHNDRAGDAYATEINATLGHRCRVVRVRP